VINLLLLTALLSCAHAAPSSGGAQSRQAQAEYLRGTLLERRGAFAEALAAYEKAMALDPSAAFIAGEAAELALQLEDRERAERWARKRLELAPNDAKSRVILGRVLWTRGDENGAATEFERALADDPTSAETLFALTELLAVKEPKRARKLLTEFQTRNPEQAPRALYELGRLDAQEELYLAAVAKFKRSIELDDGESGPSRLALAQVYEITHATADAVTEYQRLLADDPDDVELWAHIGDLQTAQGDLSAARETFQNLRLKHPGNPAAASWLASDAERGGDFKAAAAALSESSALKDDPTTNLRLGYYQIQAGGLKEAMTTLAAARKRWPSDDRIAFYLALGFDDSGEHAEAVKLLREALALKPEDREARWQLATILEKMDKISEAEPEFRRLISDKPDDAPALNYLGYSLADRGLKLPEAEGFIRRALAIEPANPAYRDSLGWALFKLGKSTEAARELGTSVRALPDDESVWDHLGSVRRAMGREEAAWRAWRLSQSFGGTKAGAKADALQKDLTDAALGELWRQHLADIHGGILRYAALCAVKGRVGGKAIEQQAMLTFRAGRDMTLELLGPLFAPVARARIDSQGFFMDQFPVDGLTDAQVRGATEGIMTAISATLSGAPFLPGPTTVGTNWGRLTLDRPGWRLQIDDDARLRSVAPTGGEAVSVGDFDKSGTRRIAKTFSTSGRFWEFSLNCSAPKFELVPEPVLPEQGL
jgi:tetratricopeptide (TPR) repeat protein